MIKLLFILLILHLFLFCFFLILENSNALGPNSYCEKIGRGELTLPFSVILLGDTSSSKPICISRTTISIYTLKNEKKFTLLTLLKFSITVE